MRDIAVQVTPAEDGSKVEIVAVRHLKGLGWLIWPLLPTGLGRRDVADYVRQFLSKVEIQAQER